MSTKTLLSGAWDAFFFNSNLTLVIVNLALKKSFLNRIYFK